jgi:hypothetical protein
MRILLVTIILLLSSCNEPSGYEQWQNDVVNNRPYFLDQLHLACSRAVNKSVNECGVIRHPDNFCPEFLQTESIHPSCIQAQTLLLICFSNSPCGFENHTSYCQEELSFMNLQCGQSVNSFYNNQP